MKDIFESIVSEEKHSELYKKIRDDFTHLSVKMMIQDIYSTYTDVDGNFVEQFQTTGIDARLFELYVWAFLQEAGLDTDRTHQYPDFLIKKGVDKAAIEVTTAVSDNKESGRLVFHDNDPLLTRDIHSEEYQDFIKNEVPLKFSSPILSKLRKKYWLNEHCRDMPFSIFLGGFFDGFSQEYSCGPLVSILFGIEFAQDMFGQGYAKPITSHNKNGKQIPSGLFWKPTAEWADMDNISAIIFSNAGTVSKFRRMGWLKGYYNVWHTINRHGSRLNMYGNEPVEFDYYIDNPPFREKWGDEIIVIHNPNAIHPLPHNLFGDNVHIWLEDGILQTHVPKNGVHVINSMSIAEFFPYSEFEHPVVQRITKSAFDSHPKNIKQTAALELYWMKNPVNKRIGVIYYGSAGAYDCCYFYRVYGTLENAKSYKLYAESDRYKDESDAVKGILSDMTD